MKNFSEKTVRTINIVLFFLFFIFIIKNKYFLILSIFPLVAYFSSKGIDMFEDGVSIYTRIFFWLIFCTITFLRIYKKDFYFSKNSIYLVITISLFVGIWIGDLAAKYVYTRVKLFINRLKYETKESNYKVVSIDKNITRYLKKPGQKEDISHNYITIEDGNKKIKMFLDGKIYNEIFDKKNIKLDLRRGILGKYFAIYLEE